MKSRITIEVDFENGQPYIKVSEDFSGDDVRDKLITRFRELLGGTSSWCKIDFNSPYHELTQLNRWLIRPIRPEDMELESRLMSQKMYENKVI